MCAFTFAAGCSKAGNEKSAPAPAAAPQPAAQPAAKPVDKGIRNVNFNNFTYRIGDTTYMVVNGKWADPQSPDATGKVKSVLYGELMSNGREQAVVLLTGNWNEGKLSEDTAQVFDFYKGDAWEVASFSGNEAEINDGTLIIKSTEWAPDDPQCCPSLAVTRQYRWNGGEFIPADKAIAGAAAGKK